MRNRITGSTVLPWTSLAGQPLHKREEGLATVVSCLYHRYTQVVRAAARCAAQSDRSTSSLILWAVPKLMHELTNQVPDFFVQVGTVAKCSISNLNFGLTLSRVRTRIIHCTGCCTARGQPTCKEVYASQKWAFSRECNCRWIT